jgi:hypothetical protein
VGVALPGFAPVDAAVALVAVLATGFAVAALAGTGFAAGAFIAALGGIEHCERRAHNHAGVFRLAWTSKTSNRQFGSFVGLTDESLIPWAVDSEPLHFGH